MKLTEEQKRALDTVAAVTNGPTEAQMNVRVILELLDNGLLALTITEAGRAALAAARQEGGER